ncbi:reverse transcriptase domain-containing protein [Tanacetum coccineum]
MVRGKGYRKRPHEKIEHWMDNEISFLSLPRYRLVDSPIILEAYIEGFQVRRLYIEGGSSSEVMYEHCFRNLGPDTRAKLRKSRVQLVGFSSEVNYPLGIIDLSVTMVELDMVRTVVTGFIVVKCHSPYNVILERLSEDIEGLKRYKDILRKEESRILESERLKEVLENKKGHRDVAPKAGNEGKDEPGKDPKENRPPEKIKECRNHLSKASGHHIRGTNRKEFVSICGRHGYQEKDRTRLDLGCQRNIVDSQKVKIKLNPKKCSSRMEEEEAFQAMKRLIAELSMLTSPIKDKLMVYISAADEAGAEVNYAPMEKLVPCHLVPVRLERLSDHGGNQVGSKLGALWQYRTPEKLDKRIWRESPKAREEQINQDPMAEVDVWKLYTDGASNDYGLGAGLILIDPEGMEYSYALRLNLNNSNNDAEYEALLAGLRIAKEKTKKYKEKVLEVVMCFNKFQIRHIPREQNRKADALSKLAAVQCEGLTNGVLVGELNERLVDVAKVKMVVEEEGRTFQIREYMEKETLLYDPAKARMIREKINNYWLEAKPLASIAGRQVKNFAFDNIECRLSLRWYTTPRKWGGRTSKPEHNAKNQDKVTPRGKRMGRGTTERVLGLQDNAKTSNEETPLSLVYDTKAVTPEEIVPKRGKSSIIEQAPLIQDLYLEWKLSPIVVVQQDEEKDHWPGKQLASTVLRTNNLSGLDIMATFREEHFRLALVIY